MITKNTNPEMEDGANKGFFEKLSYHTSDDASWGGDKSSEEYLADLRNSEPEIETVPL